MAESCSRGGGGMRALNWVKNHAKEFRGGGGGGGGWVLTQLCNIL